MHFLEAIGYQPLHKSSTCLMLALTLYELFVLFAINKVLPLRGSKNNSLNMYPREQYKNVICSICKNKVTEAIKQEMKQFSDMTTTSAII